jgi:GNAT superfamily N-acetyltransferase
MCTECKTPEAWLAHYGVLGMKWGKHKSDPKPEPDIGTKIKRNSEVVLTTKLKNGGELNVIEKGYNDYDGISKFMVRHFKSSRESMETYHEFTLTNKHGEKVGEASFSELSAKESSTGQKTLALEWIGVDKKHRRQGYGEATMKGVIKYAQDNDIHRLELTATYMGAPVYQKLGFQVMEGSRPGRDGWLEGDYYMDLPPKESVKHSLNVQSLSDYIVAEIDAVDDIDEEEEEMEQSQAAIDFLAHYGVRLDDDLTDEFTKQVDEFLAHYGVKGMKWGVIREQQDVIRRAEAQKNGTEYKKAGNLSALKTYADRQRIESGDHYRDYVKSKAYLEGGEHQFKRNESLAGKKTIEQLKNDVVKPINPEFGKPGTVQNCRRCTLTYEMRRRGYDVKATYTTNASGQHLVGLENALTPGQDKATRGMEFFKDVNKRFQANPFLDPWGEHPVKFPNFDARAYKKQLKADAKKNGTKTSWIKRNEKAYEEQGRRNADAVFKSLEKQPEGARGEVGMGWMMGGGHSVAYEVVGGKAHVIDNQSGKIYSTPKELAELTQYAAQVSYTRMDNKEINEDYLRRWAQDA